MFGSLERGLDSYSKLPVDILSNSKLQPPFDIFLSIYLMS